MLLILSLVEHALTIEQVKKSAHDKKVNNEVHGSHYYKVRVWVFIVLFFIDPIVSYKECQWKDIDKFRYPECCDPQKH